MKDESTLMYCPYCGRPFREHPLWVGGACIFCLADDSRQAAPQAFCARCGALLEEGHSCPRE
ncbi:MAG TPA: hypothetical protein PLM79_05960 [Syntrophobacteraceae bacterium]|nr:hypothetical protein [Syntrophobacteraceae bacterium]